MTARNEPARVVTIRSLLLVFAGGCLGAGAREGFTLAAGAPDGSLWTVLGVNLGGAFLLGLLIGVLTRLGPETRARREVRLFAGTGVMGGFTTYSALAVGTVALAEGAPLLGAAYALGTVVVGIVCAGLGLVLGGAVTRGVAR